MIVENRKREELRQKLAALCGAVDNWLAARRGPPDFRIHASQLQAIESVLSGVRNGIGRELEPGVEGPILARASGIEEMILAGYQIFEFYRQKFAQRLEGQFQKHLRIADEFAWACYKPVRDAVFGTGASAKEPPLVYLNAGWSPFVKERNREYQIDSVPRALLITQPDFKKAVAQLPFPVIGIPWYQAGFLPGALTIAHEVGHAVESDCELTIPLSESIAAAVPDSKCKNDWLSWSSEVFADAYGCLCCGPAFAWSLADVLAADRSTVDGAQDADYPPRSLRILLNCEMLDQLKHRKEAVKLFKHWTGQYEGPYSWSAYRGDLREVAQALLHVPVKRAKGKPAPLAKVIGFPPAWDKDARRFAEETMKQIGGQQDNMRVSFAAVQHAYGMDPANFAAAAPRFVDRLRKACRDDVRHGEGKAPVGRVELLRDQGEGWLVKPGAQRTI